MAQHDRPFDSKRSGSRPVATWRAVVVHALRVALMLAVVVLLRANHARLSRAANAKPIEVALSLAKEIFPKAAALEAQSDDPRTIVVRDSQAKVLGKLIQTSPESDRVAGFSGSTNLLVGIGEDERIQGLRIARSGDTVEHVRDIEQDPDFLRALNGLTKQQALQQAPRVDSVSGATLTSLAILEGLMRRLERRGEQAAVVFRGSLRFPDPITLAESQQHFPDAVKIEPRPLLPRIVNVLNAQGDHIGALLRSAPSGDQTIGYQGPTDTLVVFDADDKLVRMLIRKSYDNEPYVGYVRDDEYFAKLLAGKALSELSTLDLVDAQVEGVSGATMTSMAMAESLPLAAAEALQPVAPEVEAPTDKAPRGATRGMVFAIRDVGTILVLFVAGLIAFTRLRGVRWFRIAFQLVLVGYLGFLNGDMLSQAQLIGWAGNGAPWRFAPGLTALTIAAFVIPLFTKRQIYCQQICPFGAAQQLVRPKKAWRLPRSLRLLQVVPFLLLAFCVMVGIGGWPVALASLEPFDAFLWGGAASIAIAIVGLVAAFRVPMAYCRYGCPTGAVLGFIRFRGNAERLDWRDAVALLLLAYALCSYFFLLA